MLVEGDIRMEHALGYKVGSIACKEFVAKIIFELVNTVAQSDNIDAICIHTHFSAPAF